MIVEDHSTSVIYQFGQSSIREKGDMKRNVLIASALAIYFVSILGVAFNAVPIRAEGTQAPVYPRIEKTGTYFEITNSQYLNVSIISSEVIYMILFAPTNMIDYAIESANGANSTTLTLDNMQPHAAYYMFEDSYRNEKGFQTDKKGATRTYRTYPKSTIFSSSKNEAPYTLTKTRSCIATSTTPSK